MCVDMTWFFFAQVKVRDTGKLLENLEMRNPIGEPTAQLEAKQRQQKLREPKKEPPAKSEPRQALERSPPPTTVKVHSPKNTVS